MPDHRKLFWFSVPAVAGLFMLLGLFWYLGLPWASNAFGFALPGSGGLPYHIFYSGHNYTNPVLCLRAGACANTPYGSQRPAFCWTMKDLQQRNVWPLVQVGSVPALFAASYPLLTSLANVNRKLTIPLTFVPQDNGCFVLYALASGP